MSDTATTPLKGILRIARWGLVVALLLGFLLASFGSDFLEVCEQQLSPNGKIINLCREPDITDARVGVFALIIALLIVPKVGEVGLWGVSLKARVEGIEKDVAKLEANLQQSVSTNVALHISPQSLRQMTDEVKMRSTTHNAEAAESTSHGSDSVSKPASDDVSGSADDLAVLGYQLLGQWERLNEHLGMLDLAQQSEFRVLFRNELSALKSVRNSYAHAQLVTREQLMEAIALATQLQSALDD